ncbi:hypothetical protein [Leptospira bandrabouensis]|uniref:hypothetical protein n=1 Tax=Leptospira bandrabouensis TaxID=2484903 RepID=UPI001EEAA6B5|nr:hypothetical protein [Leptospira bandrabouensis]MCG6150549.1 hypothetical protein [Leptospira bandrabouensis]
MSTINFNQKAPTRKILVVTLLLSLFSLNNCKLELNNPSDPRSKSFFETALWNFFLNSLCNPNTSGYFHFGSGNTLIIPLSLKVLNSGNTVVTAISGEPLFWNESSGGVNANHQNSALNGVVFVIDKSFSRILWLDYIGEMSYGVDDWPIPETISIDEFSNGDLAVYALVNGAGRTNVTNAKTTTNAFYLARLKQHSGEIVWQGYLNKDNARLGINSYAMSILNVDRIALLFQGISEASSPTQDNIGLGYPGLPYPIYGSNATTASQKELGIAVIDGNGNGLSQSFLPNTGPYSEAILFKSDGNNIIIAGVTENNFVSTSGHPRVNESRAFFGVINSGLTWEALSYYGPTITAGTFNLQKALFANDEVFLIGKTDESYPTPNTLYPFQGTTGRRNYQILKPDKRNTGLIWGQFLGASAYNVPEVLPGNLAFNSGRQEIVGNLLAIDNGNVFTGISPDISSGTFQYPLAQARLKINPSNGGFKQLQYYDATSDSSGNNGKFLTNQVDACSGRMVTIHSKFGAIANFSTARNFEISTKPASAEP